MNADHNPNVSALLRALSPNDFLRVGINEIAYIRALDDAAEGFPRFGIYAADGTRLSVTETFDTAVAAVRHNDLVPVTLQ